MATRPATGDTHTADVLVIGAGLAGLVAACGAADTGRSVVIVDQEPGASLGGQAWWSFGGLFLIGSPEQRRLGITDSAELALGDWLGSAGFDRPEDHWPRRWAESFVEFSAGPFRSYLKSLGVKLFPIVQWAERGGYPPGGHGNSVPRFHVTWGTGPGLLRPFIGKLVAHQHAGRIRILFRHRVTELTTCGGSVTGASGQRLATSSVGRGQPSSRIPVGDFAVSATATVIASGGIGGNHDLVRQNWPSGFGRAPDHMVSGVPDSTDGLLLGIAERAGAHLIGRDRMWHYPEGVINHSPVWTGHGIRILSGPTPLWIDATGVRLPHPLYPGFDALGALRHITATGCDHSWFIAARKTISAEFALSGSEQNMDLTGKSVPALMRTRLGSGPAPAVQAFVDRGPDFLTADRPGELVAKMNALTGADLLQVGDITQLLADRDAQARTGLGKDPQITAIAATRRYFGDRNMRVAAEHEFTDPASGPLVAVRLHVLTRKTLGGLETNLDGACLRANGQVLDGLFAAGEASGFGGGGMHGYRALEGTFLGGCLHSGRIAGRAAAG